MFVFYMKSATADTQPPTSICIRSLQEGVTAPSSKCCEATFEAQTGGHFK